jgi:uncharacterized protein (TIGR04168 family)
LNVPRVSAQIGILGDLHSSWDDADVAYFNRTSYDLLLFVGDLGGTVRRDGLRIVRSMSRLRIPALVMPGNSDVEHYPRFAAEFALQRGLIHLMNEPDLAPNSGLRHATGNVAACGYSVHPMKLGELELSIVAGRPFARGGSELSFPEAIREHFGVTSLDDSTARLEALVDGIATEYVVFLGHNGPAGLGGERDALWGCDFRPEAGDWGDRDLAVAVERARQQNRRVLAVVAGHMHWSLRGGGSRRWQMERDGVLYVNPARVPRLVDEQTGLARHHVALTLTPEGAEAEERCTRYGDC